MPALRGGNIPTTRSPVGGALGPWVLGAANTLAYLVPTQWRVLL